MAENRVSRRGNVGAQDLGQHKAMHDPTGHSPPREEAVRELTLGEEFVVEWQFPKRQFDHVVAGP